MQEKSPPLCSPDAFADLKDSPYLTTASLQCEINIANEKSCVKYQSRRISPKKGDARRSAPPGFGASWAQPDPSGRTRRDPAGDPQQMDQSIRQGSQSERR